MDTQSCVGLRKMRGEILNWIWDGSTELDCTGFFFTTWLWIFFAFFVFLFVLPKSNQKAMLSFEIMPRNRAKRMTREKYAVFCLYPAEFGLVNRPNIYSINHLNKCSLPPIYMKNFSLIKSLNLKKDRERWTDWHTHTRACTHAHTHTEKQRMIERDCILTSPTLCFLNKELKLRLNKVTWALEQTYKTSQQSQSFSTWVSWDQES